MNHRNDKKFSKTTVSQEQTNINNLLKKVKSIYHWVLVTIYKNCPKAPQPAWAVQGLFCHLQGWL